MFFTEHTRSRQGGYWDRLLEHNMKDRYLQPIPIAVAVSLIAVAIVVLMNLFSLEPPAPNPFLDTPLYVDPDSRAAQQAREWQQVRPEDARLIDRIAREPQAAWFGDWDEDLAEAVDAYVSAATDAEALPLLVAYNIPHRDCFEHSTGGAPDADAYRAWIDAFLQGIGEREAIVILEPDAIAKVECLDEAQLEERYDLLRYASERLGALENLTVYLDAGNPTWMSADEAARRLKRAGIDSVHGFSLNVSNYYSNELNIGYGRAVSRQLGGKNYVIDTSRNGRGATDDDEWCNPASRALGTTPRVADESLYLDAYLWIKSPGKSDGECNGGPLAGEWWPEYALELARNAASDEVDTLQ
jgi:endoglucanase